MSRDIEMQIYGKVSDAEVLQQFASVAEAVRRAASTGIEAVNALVARLADLSSGGKIELDPHCIEAYHELVASQAAEAFSFR